MKLKDPESSKVDWNEIRYEVTSGVCTITIDSPERRNSYTPTMATELVSAARTADHDDEVRVVVLTGSGSYFCPGAYLGGGPSTFTFEDGSDGKPPEWRETSGTIDGYRRDGGGRVALAFASMRKPIITAFNGTAVGVGVTMTLPTDIRIASTAARFGFVFAKRGLVPEASSTWFLPRVVGMSAALEWLYTGRVFGADEALEAGLVSRVVAPEDLDSTVRELALEIASGSSAVSVGVSRQMLWGMLTAKSPWEAHRLESRLLQDLGKGHDVREGVSAFLEKRSPRFPLTVPQDYPDYVPPFPDKDKIE
ncbi:crotonase/enoyl-CoA hydratase family protein [Rhodococcus olei]|uniref:Crotonase/enoyl-CoA hydratase family protein n=1 Tax=Rhodococcus olei TaxID=2161675 RepID=A0ABP8NVD2_9NOCA